MSIAIALAAAAAATMACGAAYLRRRGGKPAARDWNPEDAPADARTKAAAPPMWELAVWRYEPHGWVLVDAATAPGYPLAAIDRYGLTLPMYDPVHPERGGYRITVQPPGGRIRGVNRHERRRAHAIAARVR